MNEEKRIIAEWADYENAKAVDVEFNGYGMFDYKGDLNGFTGDISIEIKDLNSPNGYSKSIHSGEHGVNDYEDDFGFTINLAERKQLPNYETKYGETRIEDIEQQIKRGE